MKTRQGFVSNSSSSSFIISIRPDREECPHCHRKDSNFLDRVAAGTGRTGDDTHLRARGMEEVVDKLRDWCYSDTKTFNELCAKICQEVVNGNEVGWVEMSYHDSIIDEFEALRQTGKLTVILDNN